MRSDLESDNSDDDEREDEKSTYDRAAYQKYLRNMPAEFLKQIKDSATKDNLPPGLVNVSESSSTEVSSMRTTVTTLTFATESEEMEYLYSNENKIEIRSPFVYKSIANFIFPTVKFWADSDMKFTEPNFGKTVPANKKEQARRICEKIVVHLGRTLNMGSGYSIGVLVPFWKAYCTEIKDELVRYRANVGSQAKEMYLEACDTGSEKLPMGDVQKLRELCRNNSLLNIRTKENSEAFKAFVCLILQAVVHKLHFGNSRCYKPVSDFVTIPDEAFGLLILENNFEKWEKYVSDGRKSKLAKKTSTKYAPSDKSTNWAGNPKALARYNSYYMMIRDRRLLVEQQDLENDIKETFSVKYGVKGRQAGKRRFADMNRNEETVEEEMPALNVAAIDSFFR